MIPLPTSCTIVASHSTGPAEAVVLHLTETLWLSHGLGSAAFTITGKFRAFMTNDCTATTSYSRNNACLQYSVLRTTVRLRELD